MLESCWRGRRPAAPSDQLFLRVRDLLERLVAARRLDERHLGVPAVPDRVFDAVEHLAQFLAPAAVQHAEVGIVVVDADDLVGGKAVGLVDHQVQGQADREIGLERGIHGHQRAFGGLVQRRVGRDDAVQHGLAVLGFANLEVGRFRCGFDEVARRVHLEQAHALARDLSAEDQRDIELHARGLERLRIALVDVAHSCAQHAGGIEHALGVPDGDGLAVFVLLELFHLQDFAHRLRDREVAGRQQHHEALLGLLVHDHLAEGADLVQPRVGPRIGEEDQSGVEFDGDAVGHGGARWQIRHLGVGRADLFQGIQGLQRFARAQGVRIDLGEPRFYGAGCSAFHSGRSGEEVHHPRHLVRRGNLKMGNVQHFRQDLASFLHLQQDL
jgi:hypothetical protein